MSTLISCQASDIDLQCPGDNLWPLRILEINVKSTFIAGGGVLASTATMTRKRMVQEESHALPLEKFLNDVVSTKDWSDNNVCDVLDSMRIPTQRSSVDQIVGCAVAMAAAECYKDRKVLRMRVEIETLVSHDDERCGIVDFEGREEDAYSIDVEAEDFWETAAAFEKLRKSAVDDHRAAESSLCSICLVEFMVGSEVSATPCSHVFHHRCIRAWLKKCRRKFCPNCVTPLA